MEDWSDFDESPDLRVTQEAQDACILSLAGLFYHPMNYQISN